MNNEKLNHIPSLNWVQLIEVKAYLLRQFANLVLEGRSVGKLQGAELKSNLIKQATISSYTSAICLRQLELINESDIGLEEQLYLTN